MLHNFHIQLLDNPFTFRPRWRCGAYDKDVFELRGVYNVGDNDFDLSQFGLFLSGDTVFMTFHINDMIEIMGRRLINGDVLEMPHLLDDTALNAAKGPLPKFYVYSKPPE